VIQSITADFIVFVSSDRPPFTPFWICERRRQNNPERCGWSHEIGNEPDFLVRCLRKPLREAWAYLQQHVEEVVLTTFAVRDRVRSVLDGAVNNLRSRLQRSGVLVGQAQEPIGDQYLDAAEGVANSSEMTAVVY